MLKVVIIPHKLFTRFVLMFNSKVWFRTHKPVIFTEENTKVKARQGTANSQTYILKM